MHEFTSVPMSIDPHASGRVEERLEFQVPGISKPFAVTHDLCALSNPVPGCS